MARFVTIQTEVDAIQIKVNNYEEVRKWLLKEPNVPFTMKRNDNTFHFTVQEVSGMMKVVQGDYLIRQENKVIKMTEECFNSHYQPVRSVPVLRDVSIPAPRYLEDFLKGKGDMGRHVFRYHVEYRKLDKIFTYNPKE